MHGPDLEAAQRMAKRASYEMAGKCRDDEMAGLCRDWLLAAGAAPAPAPRSAPATRAWLCADPYTCCARFKIKVVSPGDSWFEDRRHLVTIIPGSRIFV